MRERNFAVLAQYGMALTYTESEKACRSAVTVLTLQCGIVAKIQCHMSSPGID